MSDAQEGRALMHGERSALESNARQDRADQQRGTGETAPICSNGMGEQAGVARSAARPAALPCQNSDNSNKQPKRYRLKRAPGSEGFYTSKDNDRAYWRQLDGDTLERWGSPSGAEAKSAFHFRLNVAAFVEHWGRNHCLFFTVTDEANLHPSQFARRWNSFMIRNGSWIVSFIRVLEPQKQGRPHYHLLVAVE